MMFRMDRAGWENVIGELGSSTVGKGIVSLILNKKKSLEEKNVPLLDNIFMLPLDIDPKNRVQDAKNSIKDLPSGITHYIIHAAKDSKEIRKITPNDCDARIGDYNVFKTNELKEYIEEQNVHIIGYQKLQELMTQG
jgi:predicted class III extradiol MEMO1 family dioxygenase